MRISASFIISDTKIIYFIIIGSSIYAHLRSSRYQCLGSSRYQCFGSSTYQCL
ncbi:unnamed protein product, partial [Rotaria magnacalcarata]